MYAFFPLAPALSVTKVGIIVGALIVALSVAVVPEGIRFRQAHDDGSIEATPGPKLDAWMAKQRDKRRADGLEQLRKSDDETKLYEVESLLRGDSPVRQEALDFMRHLPNRQIEATEMLESQSSIVLHFLADIDLQPTPDLCKAARGYLREAVRQRRAMFGSTINSFVGAEFEEGVDAIRWISKNCGCKEELSLMEAYAREQNQDAPDVKRFLDALAEMRQGK